MPRRGLPLPGVTERTHCRAPGIGGSDSWRASVASCRRRNISAARHLLHPLRELVEGIEHDIQRPQTREFLDRLLSRLREWSRSVLGGPAGTSLLWHRILLLLDLGTTVCIGMLEDDVFGAGGFEGIDDLDLREWRLQHGALPSRAWSAPIAA